MTKFVLVAICLKTMPTSHMFERVICIVVCRMCRERGFPTRATAQQSAFPSGSDRSRSTLIVLLDYDDALSPTLRGGLLDAPDDDGFDVQGRFQWIFQDDWYIL